MSRRIEDLRPVGRAEQNQADARVEPVDLGEELVERLLPLVMPSKLAVGAARPAERIGVDEDDSLLRGGRFDRQVLVDRPDKAGRIQILNIYLGKIRLGSDVSAEDIAALTAGFTGADLATLVNEAALLATRRKSQNVIAADFTAAIERILAGLEKKNRLLSPKEREIVAYHEWATRWPH